VAKSLLACATCSAKFIKRPGQIEGRAFCSKACYGESLKGQVPHNKGRRTVAEKPCAHCGAVISGWVSKIAKRKYCSKECTAKAFATTDIQELLAGKIRKIEGSDCWLWTGSTRGGYGRFKIATVTQEAHRASYELYVGPIPDGLQLDHLCRNRSCINPAHLEPVTCAENIRRGLAGKGPRSEGHKMAVSVATRRRMEIPVELEAQRERMRNASSSPKRAAAAKAAMQTPEYRKAQSERTKRQWAKRKNEG
jgi:endogenous inhibitor of DNA gyrase (YacG/DUF329 family)